MSVLFVELADEGDVLTRFKGKDVDVYGELGRKVVSGRSGGAAGELIPASTALIILTNRLSGEAGGITIREVAPVYWLDAADVEPGATQDTAVPAWRFRTDQGDFYVEGFVE